VKKKIPFYLDKAPPAKKKGKAWQPKKKEQELRRAGSSASR